MLVHNVALCHTPYGVSHYLESLQEMPHTQILCVASVALPVTAGFSPAEPRLWLDCLASSM